MSLNKDRISNYALVMAGGKGTRLWPESTAKKPKQYLKVNSSNSLLRETLIRLDGVVDSKNRFIVTTEDQKSLASEHSKGLINDDGLIFEPSGRNTAPCILLGLASLSARGVKSDSVVSIVPADHVILNSKAFQETLKLAQNYAFDHEKVVTLGINPHFPHTGYGYIEKSEKVDDLLFKVSAFKEKPDIELAKDYLKTGQYLWNSGMFISRVDVLLREFRSHCPDIFEFFDKLKVLLKAGASTEKLSQVYSEIEKISIDYAVMEKSHNIEVLSASFDWNDLGSWDALESVLGSKDKNTIAAAKEVNLIESEGNIIYAPNQTVALQNVNDMVIVSNEEVLMVLPKKDSQNVSKFLKKS